MSRWVLALASLVLLAPLASAQVPDVPETPDPVTLVCAAAPVDLPVCTQQDPLPPPAREEPPQDAAAPQPSPGPQDAGALPDDARRAVQDVVEDPTSAPDRLAGLAATLLQFVKDLLGLPVAAAEGLAAQATAALDGLRVGLAAVGSGAKDAGAGLVDALAHVADEAKGALASVGDAIASLFDNDAAPAKPRAPRVRADVGATAGEATGLVDGLVASLSR